MSRLLYGIFFACLIILVLKSRSSSNVNYDVSGLPVMGVKNISVQKVLNCSSQGCTVLVAGSGYRTEEMIAPFKIKVGRYEVEYNQDVIISATPLEDRRTEFEKSRQTRADHYANSEK